MGKLRFILLALACCLCFAAGNGGKSTYGAVRPAELTLDRAAADEWRCERVYNSDLNLPRLTREVVPVQTAPSLSQGRVFHADRTDRAVLRSLPGGGSGSLKETSAFYFSIRFSGAHAVDYYVYRLHRLII